MNEIEVIKRMQVVELKPGDLVVVECSNNLSDKILDSIRQQMLKGIPEGVRVVVLDGGTSFRVFREPSGEKMLADCLPPNPANYKSDFRCMTVAIARLEKVHAALIQEVAKREAAEETVRLTHQEIAVDDLLLAERDRLLDVIPECANHGNRCIPHAIEWVLSSINLEKAADALLGWFRKGVDCSPPQNFIQNLRVARQGGPTWEEDHAPSAFEAKRA